MKKLHSIEERRYALRLSKQVCGVIQLIMQCYNTGEYDSIVDFYNSKTYELLSDCNTKLWWCSIYAIFEIFKTEKETGSVLNSPYILGDYV
jgi:hypothetical protein